MDLTDFSHAPMMVHSLDDTGVLRFVNDRWLETLKYTKEEVIGKRSIDFLTPSSRQFAEKIVFPFFREHGRISNVRYEFLTKENEIVYVLMSAIRVPPVDDSLIWSVAFCFDVTSILTRTLWGTPFSNLHMVDVKTMTERLVQLRKDAGHRQEEVAAVLGVSNRTYQRIEYGESQIAIGQILRLADYYKVSPFRFFLDPEVSWNRGDLRILLVDDDVEQLSTLEEVLVKWGFSVTLATNGLEALKEIDRTEYDILMTDLKMPVMSGTELIDEIRKRDLKVTPEIFVASSNITSDLKKRLSLDDEHIISKPLNMEKLRTLMVKRFL